MYLEQQSPDSLRKQARIVILTIFVILLIFQGAVNYIARYRGNQALKYEEYLELYGEE